VPFVDGIFYSAFDVHPLAGASLLLGAALLIVPALLGLSDPAQRVPAAAFGAVWLAIIAAAALGNYPTPVVGYGGSAIVGYMFSLAVLRLARGRAGASRSPAGSMDPSADERSMRVGLVGMGRAAAIADRSATAPRESRAARHYRMLRRHR
jgi:hypothetical protein